MFKSLKNFISYWYFRYLLVTELYIVESWERAMIYSVFFVVFLLLSLFNNYVILSSVEYFMANRSDFFIYNPLQVISDVFFKGNTLTTQ